MPCLKLKRYGSDLKNSPPDAPQDVLSDFKVVDGTLYLLRIINLNNMNTKLKVITTILVSIFVIMTIWNFVWSFVIIDTQIKIMENFEKLFELFKEINNLT